MSGNGFQAPRVPDPRMIPHRSEPVRDHGGFEPGGLAARDLAADELVVRPFMVTGGRTTPLLDGLRVESLVHARPAALSAPLRYEQRAAVRFCQQPRSIAELAAELSIPLGVARVLVGDLVTAGCATVQTPDELQIAALERIRDLVRAL